MRRFSRKFHLWIAIPTGVFITILCLTGAALVFEEEFTVLANRSAYRVDASGREALPMGQLMPLVNGQLPDTIAVSGVQIFQNPNRTYIGMLPGKGHRTIFIDPYTASVVDKEGVRPGAFFRWMKGLHRSLLLSGANRGTGRLIVGVASLTFVIILLTGIIVWMPKNTKGLRMRLSVRIKSGWRWFWYDLHVAGGFYAALFLLLMALTSLTWSFRWYRDGVYSAFGVETVVAIKSDGAAPPKEAAPSPGDTAPPTDAPGDTSEKEDTPPPVKSPLKPKAVNYMAWDVVLDSLSRAGTGFRTLTIQNKTATLLSDRAIRSSRAADRYVFDEKTGAIKSSKLFADQSKTCRMNAWIFSLHTGEWGGFATKCLTFIAALIGAFLPATGYYLYIRRLRKKKKRQ